MMSEPGEGRAPGLRLWTVYSIMFYVTLFHSRQLRRLHSSPHPSLDTQKNQCENGEYRVHDKPDYHVFNSRQKWRKNKGQFRP
jgi:hypothetical protein